MHPWRAAALLAALALAGCAPEAEPGQLMLNGRLEAPLVDLAPKVAGRVIAIHAREGDRVKSGEVLVRLDLGDTALAVTRDAAALDAAKARYQDLAAGSRPAEIASAAAQVAQCKAATALARKELGRQEELRAKHIGPERDYDRARTDLDRAIAAEAESQSRLQLAQEGFRKMQTEAAQRDLARAQSVLEQSQVVARESELRAPADAVVLHRIAEPGLLLLPGQSAMTLGFADRLYVRTFIPEPRLGAVRQGLKVSVQVDAFPGRRFPATVTEISPDAEFTPKAVETKLERINLVYAAKVDLDLGWHEPLVPGQPAEVLVDLSTGPTR